MTRPKSEPFELYVRLRTALQSSRPVPGDVRGWLLSAMYACERDGDTLDHALGLGVATGRAHDRVVHLRARAQLEADLLNVADCIGPRNATTAARIARTLAGRHGQIPTIALDFLKLAMHRHGNVLPKSRTAIERILTGQTRAARLGVVERMRTI